MDIDQFYQEIFPQDSSYRLVWTKKDKQSHWFKRTDLAVEFIKQNQYNDVFFGLCTTDIQLPTNKRIKKNQAKLIRSFHMDIDVLSDVKEAHKSDQYPKTVEKAIEIANAIMEPTYIISSGYGIHPYWLMDEHYEIHDADYWTALIQQWQGAHRELFPQYKIDSTHDLPRVMRCPGTFNCKNPLDPQPCEIIVYNESAYYSDTEFEDAICFDPQKTITASAPTGEVHRNLTQKQAAQWLHENGVRLENSAALTSENIFAIMSFEPEFVPEFNQATERKSASEYDMRLANIAARFGWDANKVATTIIHHRRHNHCDLKLDRPDYYANTIRKALEKYRVDRVEKKSPSEISLSDKEAIREYLYAKLGIGILRILRYNRSPNEHFELELTDYPGKSIPLGNIQDGLMNQGTFSSKITATTLEIPNSIDKKAWKKEIFPKLLKLVEDGIAPETATYEGQVLAWVPEFLRGKSISGSIEEFFEDRMTTKPFFHNNRVYFQLEALAQWVNTSKPVRFDSFHFSIAMIKCGFIQERIRDSHNCEMQMWATPENYIAPSVEDE